MMARPTSLSVRNTPMSTRPQRTKLKSTDDENAPSKFDSQNAGELNCLGPYGIRRSSVTASLHRQVLAVGAENEKGSHYL